MMCLLKMTAIYFSLAQTGHQLVSLVKVKLYLSKLRPVNKLIYKRLESNQLFITTPLNSTFKRHKYRFKTKTFPHFFWQASI